jgi:hypothetical protein
MEERIRKSSGTRRKSRITFREEWGGMKGGGERGNNIGRDGQAGRWTRGFTRLLPTVKKRPKGGNIRDQRQLRDLQDFFPIAKRRTTM